MTADFTYEMYGELLDAGMDRGVSFLTVREYLESDSLPSAFVVLRHDVDRKPGNALDFARIEADRGVRSTYYVRTVPETFRPSIVQEIERLGHEVGYHYEDLDRADGDVAAAHDSFRTNLQRLREVVDVGTVCMHGNPLTSHDNRDMWKDGPTFDEYGLVGEAYLSMDFVDVDYYSDTGRSWRDGALKIDDHTVGDDDKTTQVETTPELIDLVASSERVRYCILTHPDRWTDTFAERVVEVTFDTAKNTAKYALGVLPTGR